MRFKKDGKVFDRIEAALKNFCVHECYGCAPGVPRKDEGCMLWCAEHPAEAARLMGYEVVEDGKECEPVKCYRDGGCGPYEMNSCSECPASKPEYAEKKEANMDKQKLLKDWTLGEIQRYCATRNGNCSDDCAFSRKGVGLVCKVALKPRYWELSTPPRFTEEEVARADHLYQLYGDGMKIFHSKSGDMFIRQEKAEDPGLWIIPAVWFPSIGAGEGYQLSDIVGGGT